MLLNSCIISQACHFDTPLCNVWNRSDMLTSLWYVLNVTFSRDDVNVIKSPSLKGCNVTRGTHGAT